MTLFPESPQDLLGIMKRRELHCKLFLFSLHVRVMKTWMRPSWLWRQPGCLGHCATNGPQTGRVVKNKTKKHQQGRNIDRSRANTVWKWSVCVCKGSWLLGLCNSHQMPCSSSFMLPVLLSTPNTLTSLHEWTDITCLSQWENMFRLIGSSLGWSLEDAETANSPFTDVVWDSSARWGRLSKAAPQKARVRRQVPAWPHWTNLRNYPTGAKHEACYTVELLKKSVLTFLFKS